MLKTGLVFGAFILGSMITYKAGIYINIRYKLIREKKQRIADLATIAEYKRQLEKEKED